MSASIASSKIIVPGLRFREREKKMKGEPVQDTINCPHCGQVNRKREAACFRCGTALTTEEGVRRQKLAASGFVLEEILANPEEAMFDEYIAVFGERIEKLLEPVVAKLFAKEREREREAGR